MGSHSHVRQGNNPSLEKLGEHEFVDVSKEKQQLGINLFEEIFYY